MNRNYWQEYWESYYNFMALYLSEVQRLYPNADIKEKYTEVADLIYPSVRPEDYEIYDEYDEVDDVDEALAPPLPGGGGIGPVIIPGGGQINLPNPFNPPNPPNNQNNPMPSVSPGGGQFAINNCKKVAIVRIRMRQGFNPSNFYLIVESYDRRSIQGYRIACSDGRVRFVAMSVEYRNIDFIECAF